MIEKLKYFWAVTWRLVAALFVSSFIKIKIVDKKIEYRGRAPIPVPPFKVDTQWPHKVTVKYRHKGRWISPLTYVILLLKFIIDLWDKGIKEFFEDIGNPFSYGGEEEYSWEYKQEYNASKFRLWLDSFILIRVHS